MLNHINLVNITFSFNEGFHAEVVYSNCERTPPPPPTPTVHFDNKSNMADGIKLTLMRRLHCRLPNKIVILVFVTCLLDSALINPLTRQWLAFDFSLPSHP